MNTHYPDFTEEKLQALLDPKNPMANHSNPLVWYKAWTVHFGGYPPDAEAHPIAYAAMRASWKERVNSENGYHWARTLLGQNGTNTQLNLLDTRCQTLLYHDVDPTWISKLIGNKSAFENAYRIAFPNGDYPEHAISAFFSYRSDNVTTRPLYGSMLRALRPNMSCDTHVTVFRTLNDSGRSVWSTMSAMSNLSRYPIYSVVYGYFMDVMHLRTQGSSSAIQDLQGWIPILSDIRVSNATAFRHEALRALTYTYMELPGFFSKDDIYRFIELLPRAVRSTLMDDMRQFIHLVESEFIPIEPPTHTSVGKQTIGSFPKVDAWLRMLAQGSVSPLYLEENAFDVEVS